MELRKRKINEEEYAQKIILYVAASRQDAERVLDYARKSYGLSRYDSGIDSRMRVYAYVEKDANNDSYFYDMRKELMAFGKRIEQNRYRNVSEKMVLKKNILKEDDETAVQPGGFDPNDPYNQVKLVDDPKVRHGKEWADNGGNFPVERNGNIYYVSRSIAVSLATFCRDKYGRWCVLANQRGPSATNAGLWNLPAGFLDYGESTEDAAIRETFEETGVDVSGAKLRLLGTNSSRFGGSQNVNMAYVCVLDGVIDDYPVSDQNSEPGEVSDIKWIPILDKDGNQTGIIEKFQWNKRPGEIYGRAYVALTPYINSKKKYSDITRYLRDAIIDDDNVKYFLNRIADDMKKNITNPKALLYMIDLLKSAANASRHNPQSK